MQRVLQRFLEKSALTRHIPPPQFARYLLVGGFNTAFGWGVYALFTSLLTPYFAYGYLIASLLASLISITVAFLGYKWFVFRTKGNYFREWCRALALYSGIVLLGLALLPVLVLLVRSATDRPNAAPYIAGALLSGINVLLSFFGNRHFSFRPQKP